MIYWLFAIEAALIPSMAFYAYDEPVVSMIDEPLSSVTFEAEAGLDIGPIELFLNGGSKSTQLQLEGDRYWPILQRYDIGAGVRFGGFEIGARHYCEHPVAPYDEIIAPVDTAKREIYVRFEISRK